MFNVERFEKIFGSASSADKTPRNQKKRRARSIGSIGSELKKRKQPAEKKVGEFSLNVTINKTPIVTPTACPTQSPLSRLNDTVQSVDSPDKKNILQHLSCGIEGFENEPVKTVDNTFIEMSACDRKSNKFATRLDLMDPEVFSPEIEEFSENDDLFQATQSKFIVADVNCEIAAIHQHKPKYKPKNKVPKLNGLMEKLRSMKNKRNTEAISFVRSLEHVEGLRKIEIVGFSALCRRLLVRFNFVDEAPDPDHDDYNHFFVVSIDYITLFSKQVFYDVVFKTLSTNEITTNHFMHFLKMRATQSY